MGSAETVAGERDVVGMGTELVVMGAAGADEFDVWTRGIESRCTFFLHLMPRLLICQRYWLWKKRQGEMQKQVWTDEKGYWFLNILACHPDSQGKGIGGALVRHISRMVRNYLEGTNFRLTRMD